MSINFKLQITCAYVFEVWYDISKNTEGFKTERLTRIIVIQNAARRQARARERIALWLKK